jgi:hypothetical protein
MGMVFLLRLPSKIRFEEKVINVISSIFQKILYSFKIFFDLIRLPDYKLHNWI